MDTARIALIVRTAPQTAQPRNKQEDGDPVRGVQVLLTNVEVGRTNESGYVMLSNLPASRVTVAFRAPTFAPLTCRITPRADRVDTVDVTFMPERKVAVWTTPGCRARR